MLLRFGTVQLVNWFQKNLKKVPKGTFFIGLVNFKNIDLFSNVMYYIYEGKPNHLSFLSGTNLKFVKP